MLQSIMQAWATIIRCRRQLKWICAYAYFEFCAPQAKQQQRIFEFLQAGAEAVMDKVGVADVCPIFNAWLPKACRAVAGGLHGVDHTVHTL